jgi:hypothetical protein
VNPRRSVAGSVPEIESRCPGFILSFKESALAFHRKLDGNNSCYREPTRESPYAMSPIRRALDLAFRLRSGPQPELGKIGNATFVSTGGACAFRSFNMMSEASR